MVACFIRALLLYICIILFCLVCFGVKTWWCWRYLSDIIFVIMPVSWLILIVSRSRDCCWKSEVEEMAPFLNECFCFRLLWTKGHVCSACPINVLSYSHFVVLLFVFFHVKAERTFTQTLLTLHSLLPNIIPYTFMPKRKVFTFKNLWWKMCLENSVFGDVICCFVGSA